ncbi:site-specific DNA-methyltransferase [Chromobacterium violaceum]|nr:site-specific DNA-methyltransferase [Chromobacterium violaceum]OQS26679.1 site-specific DNA-methyltransferase [Chromobacterium violaceum]
MRAIPDCCIDSIVTDPPYGLNFMGKRWDTDVPSVEVWRECHRVLKPGGHLLAFAGTRTQHRMAVRIEDAGFEIRDMIAWVYGSGFPKSRNLDGEWEGWGTALKPALEPITVARKPLIGTVAANMSVHGTGAINISATRVGEAPGRWPANLIHDGSDEVVAAFPAQAGAAAPVLGNESSTASIGRVTGRRARVPGAFHGDGGSAARFFYCAKACRRDRNEGCEHLEKRPLHWSSGSANPGSFQSAGTDKSSQNNHPTVKPTDLMAYLCRLVTPPGGVVLDPFTGSASTGKAALREGFRFIGIEIDADHFAIANARLLAVLPPHNDLFKETA